MTKDNGQPKRDRRRRPNKQKPTTSTGAATTTTTGQAPRGSDPLPRRTATPPSSRASSTSKATSSDPSPSAGRSSGRVQASAAEASRSSPPTAWEGGSLTLVTPQGQESVLRLAYVDGYKTPMLILEHHVVGALVNEDAATSVLNFLTLAAMLDPANLSRAEP